MPIAAISYDIRAGYEDEIAEVISGFTRPRTSTVGDDNGTEVARILSTAVFIKNDTMVRFIEYDGDLTAVARFMSTQPGVQEFERRMAPYLASPRDTGTVEGFVRTFTESSMRCIALLGRR